MSENKTSKIECQAANLKDLYNNLLDEKQAASFLQVTPGTLAVWRSQKRYDIRYIKIGRNVRYRLSDLIAWLESRIQANGATA